MSQISEELSLCGMLIKGKDDGCIIGTLIAVDAEVDQAYICNVSHNSFGRRRDLVIHERTVRCGEPKEPRSAPKRWNIVEHLHEDTATHCTRCCAIGRATFRRITRSHSRILDQYTHGRGLRTRADNNYLTNRP